MKHPKKLYQIRVDSPRGSDAVKLETEKRTAKREAKRLTKETGKQHHVLTLDDDDGLGELRGLLTL